MGTLSCAHPGVLRLLQFLQPLGSGEMVHLLEGLDLSQEGPQGRIVHEVVPRRPLLPFTGRHGGLCRAGLRRSRGPQFSAGAEVVSRGQRRRARGDGGGGRTGDEGWRRVVVAAAGGAAAGGGVVTSAGAGGRGVVLTVVVMVRVGGA